jgi:SOS-response transcriptional repressor LexA
MEASFGELLKELRRGCSLTLHGLAERVGVTPGYLSMIENGRVDNPPSMKVLVRLEAALAVRDSRLCRAAQWERTPEPIREQLRRAQQRSGTDAAPDAAGQGQASSERFLQPAFTGDPRGVNSSLSDSVGGGTSGGGTAVPLINKVAAGYPAGFTDLDYPARGSDEVVFVPGYTGLHGGDDPDAFAATVCGDSMTPAYRAGDIVVFSPLADVIDGSDCFARLEPDHESTFKRVFFEDEGSRIRLEPLNPAYPTRTVQREAVAGLFRAVWRMSRL